MSKPIFKSSFSDSSVVVDEELITNNFCFIILKTSNILLAIIELITIYNLKLVNSNKYTIHTNNIKLYCLFV